MFNLQEFKQGLYASIRHMNIKIYTNILTIGIVVDYCTLTISITIIPLLLRCTSPQHSQNVASYCYFLKDTVLPQANGLPRDLLLSRIKLTSVG